MSKNKASLHNKIYRKIHWIIFSKIKPGKWINNIYSSYRHRKVIPTSQNTDSVYITQIPNEGAGIGHQISNINSGIHASMVYGVKFAYPGLKNKKWEKFLGFYSDCDSVADLKKKGYKVRTLPYFNGDGDKSELIDKIIHSYSDEKVILNLNLDQFYANQYEVIPFLKPRFEGAEARKDDKLIYDSSCVNIAVHIRRGDIVSGQTTGDTSLTKRWLDIDYYKNIVQLLAKELNGRKYKIYIFSEGDAKEYKTFEQYGPVKYCFDMSAMDSFLHMIRADILITSKSSFSYKPALLSDGIRVCPDGFWHGYPDDEKWIVASSRDGKFDVNKLEDALHHIIDNIKR